MSRLLTIPGRVDSRKKGTDKRCARHVEKAGQILYKTALTEKRKYKNYILKEAQSQITDSNKQHKRHPVALPPEICYHGKNDEKYSRHSAGIMS